MARVLDLPAEAVTPGMVWPNEFTGTNEQCHLHAIRLSATRVRGVSVEMDDGSIVSYVNGKSQLVSGVQKGSVKGPAGDFQNYPRKHQITRIRNMDLVL